MRSPRLALAAVLATLAACDQDASHLLTPTENPAAGPAAAAGAPAAIAAAMDGSATITSCGQEPQIPGLTASRGPSLSLTQFTGSFGTSSVTETGAMLIDLLAYNGTPTGGSSGKMTFPNDLNDVGQVVGAALNGDNTTYTAWAWSGAAGYATIAPLDGDATSYALSNNNAGVVVGYSSRAGRTRAFRWAGGAAEDLGPAFAGDDSTVAYAINDAGQIAGHGRGAHGHHAFLYQGGAFTDLGVPTGWMTTYATSLASNGYVAGWGVVQGGQIRSFLWRPGVGFTDIPLAAGASQQRAFGVNKNGEVVGWVKLLTGFYRGFYWSPATGTVIVSTLGGSESRLWAINDAGVATGYARQSSGEYRAVKYTPAGGLASLGKETGGCSSYGYGINRDGDVGGNVDFVPTRRAVIWPTPAKHPPAVTITSKVDATCSTLPGVAFTFSDDDGANDGPFTYTVNWGDGTTSTGTATPGQTITVTRSTPYAVQGSYNVTVTVTDGGGLPGSATTSVLFECNRPPAPANAVVSSGTCTALAAVAFDVTDPDGAADGPWTYTIAWGDESTPTTASVSSLSRVSATHAYAVSGTYTVTVTLADRRGLSAVSTKSISYECSRPPVPAVVARSAGTCSTVPALTFAVSDDDGAVDGPWSYEVSWGDGSATTTGTTALATNVLVSHGYAVSGSYTVTVKATDRRGQSGTTTTELAYECSRAPTPIVSTLVNGTCSTTPSVTFSVADLDGAIDAPWAYEVDWGDGSAAQSGSVAAVGTDVKLQHAYAVSGTYTVTVRATDKRGLSGTTDAKLTYDCNRPPVPTISATANGSCAAASSVTFAVADADGAIDGPWSYEVTWGDGSAPTAGTAATLGASVSEPHTYAVSGTYAVAVKVTDRRGLTGTASSSVTYYCNRPPVPSISATVDGTCSVTPAVTFAVADADGAIDGPWSYTIAWGDGSAATTGSAASVGTAVTESHAYAVSGTYTVTVTVADKRGLTGTTSRAVTYYCNRPPAAAVTARVAATCTAGASLSFAVSDADGAIDGAWGWTIAWGDGTTSSGSATSLATPVTAPHAYLTNGSREVTITVTDRRGLSGTTATTLTRSCVATACAATPGFWKNHESDYPYPYAATAPWLRGGSSAPTWDWVISQDKASGNTYLQLASHWAAATLNRSRGAPMSASVISVLDLSEAWLRARQNSAGSIPTLQDPQAEAWKDVLDSYNNGKLGPPGCN